MATFSAPKVKKAIKLAQELGLTVAGFEVLPDGGVRILTTQAQQDAADAALDGWMRAGNG